MTGYKKFKKRVYEIVGPAKHGDKASIIFDIIICSIVILSSLAVFVDIFGWAEGWHDGLVVFEYVCVAIFILEYLVRLWVSNYQYPNCSNLFEAMKEYVTSFDSLIDIVSILSVLINEIPAELMFFRMFKLLKLIKLVRLVKIGDHIHQNSHKDGFFSKVQKRIYEILYQENEGDKLALVYDILTILLIVTSVVFIILETFPISDSVRNGMHIFEYIIASVFALEYVMRVWVAPLEYPEKTPDKARMAYIFSFFSLIDLLSIMPVFIVGLPTELAVVKVFKLCKILRLVKVSRYVRGFATFFEVIKKKARSITFSLIAIALLITLCSLLMYAMEHKEQPDVFVHGFSGFVYGFNLITNLGAKLEMAPVTPIGQTLSAVMVLLGGCLFGVPVAIIGEGLGEMIRIQAGEENQPEKATLVLEQYIELDNKQKDLFHTLYTSLYNHEQESTTQDSTTTE